MNNSTQCSILLVITLIIPSSISVTLNAITPDKPLKDGDVLLSLNANFALGFFSPGRSRNRYVGLWFNKVPTITIAWVANRDNPILPVSQSDGNSTRIGGSLEINGNGGLVIYGEDRKVPVWSSNVTAGLRDSSLMAKLLDIGNLVLLENNGGRENVLWQGFDHPTNTILPFMKVGVNRRSGLNWSCTSWKSKDDPGTGNYSLWIDPRGYPQMFLLQGQTPQWRTGSWTGLRWSGAPILTSPGIFNTSTDIYNISFVNDENEIFLVWGVTNSSIFSRFELVESGIVEKSRWHDDVGAWVNFWTSPVEACDRYGHCGPNSNCDPGVDVFECMCLPGFEPKVPENWNMKDASDGCVRKDGLSVCGNREGFVKVVRAKVPESSTAQVNMNLGWKECEQECLRNCSCMAFSNADERWGGVGCVTWHGDLMDTRTYSKVGQDLYVRVDSITLAQYGKPNGSLGKKGKIALVISVFVFILGVSILLWLVRRKRKGKQSNAHSSKVTGRTNYFEDSTADDLDDESRINSDLPFYDLPTIAAATDNFSAENKLGKGGFGSVYKGVLDNGNKVAVKRLSKDSGQGIEEFKNEVVLIAKLQHRNLVRILGCCVQDEEKMLIYEYLSNKSLDSFIFNEETRSLLDWTRRFEIICGIARGILYLHQDSRLRIIHRDLKASNVLLDAFMNPKIADFGMARIFKADQNEANTNRVVGTYGYMAPEYAMRGLFSVKSDVYSFGVLLLEIITGRKNNAHYYQEHQHPDLVVHVWNLWTEDKALEIADSTLGESYPINKFLRCIQIALLCVQEYATDRPTISAVVFMLGNDTAVPSPKQPAFYVKGTYRRGDPSTGTEGTNYSVNDVTCTIVEPR